MSCLAPACPLPATIGAVFCEVHLRAPKWTRAAWVSARKRKTEMRVDASNISTRLWIGAAPPVDRDLPKIDTLVLCAMEIQPPRLAFHGRVLRCPLDDTELGHNELSMALIVSKEVSLDLMANKTVLVTCAQGRNRSALVAALALGRITRRSAAQIIEIIRSRRRRDCLSNPHFVTYLEKFIPNERPESRGRGTTRVRRRT